MRARLPRPTPMRASLIAFVLLLPALSHAHLLRLTYERCVVALGQPVATEGVAVTPATEAYRFDDESWTRIIQFWHGKAHAMSIGKKDGSQISEAEIKVILDEFSDGRRWDKDENGTYWRHDGQILAVPGKYNDLLVMSAEFAIRVNRFSW